MLLLFGLHTAARVLATSQRTCRKCRSHAPHEVVEATRKFTLFFIPVCRVGAARYFDTCTVCGQETEEEPRLKPTRPATTHRPSSRKTPRRGRHKTAKSRGAPTGVSVGGLATSRIRGAQLRGVDPTESLLTCDSLGPRGWPPPGSALVARSPPRKSRVRLRVVRVRPQAGGGPPSPVGRPAICP